MCLSEISDLKKLLNYYLVSIQLGDIDQSNGSWIPPSNWTGSNAVFYESFDSSDGFVLMEGTRNTSDSVPLVSGKVNYIGFVFRKVY